MFEKFFLSKLLSIDDLSGNIGIERINDRAIKIRNGVQLAVIDDEDFAPTESLRKNIRASDQASFDSIEYSSEFTEQSWEELDTDKVLLATRESGWISSDPRKLHVWFKRAVELKGEQLRRLCRYVKAWRDYGACGTQWCWQDLFVQNDLRDVGPDQRCG